MPLSNAIPGKKPKTPKEETPRPPDRPSHAPTFARSHDEPEPDADGPYMLDETRRPHRPARRASRTQREAHEIGLAAPEALDLTAQEINSEG